MVQVKKEPLLLSAKWNKNNAQILNFSSFSPNILRQTEVNNKHFPPFFMVYTRVFVQLLLFCTGVSASWLNT